MPRRPELSPGARRAAAGASPSGVPLRDRLVAGLHAGRGSGALLLLAALLAPIPLLLVAHQLHFWDVPPFGSPRWAVNGDRSVIEVLGYLELAVAVVLLVLLGVHRRRGPVYVGWAATLVLVVLDDSLGLHERGGAWLHHHDLVPALFGLPAQEWGELVTWALLGVPVLLLLWATHRTSPPRARRDSWALAGLTALLVAFALGVDLVHEVIEELTDNGVVDLLVTFVEAAGELGAMSALLAYTVHVWRSRDTASPAAAVPGEWPSPAVSS